MSLRGAVALGLGVVLTAAVVPERVVWAQAVPAEGPEALARADFDAGVRHARAQHWAEALAAFERSRARVDQAHTALNVAVAQRELGRLRAARQTLRACLAMPQTAADATLGRDAALLMALVLDALAHVSLSVDAPDATVRVDGEMAPDARAVELDPGDHTVTVSAPGRVEETFSLMLRAGERVARTVRLRALPARVAVGVTPSDATVYANDVRLGRGAVQWEGDAGPLRLRVARPDYHDLTRTLTLAPGASLTERFDLTRTVRPLHRRPWFWGGVALAAAVVVGATTALVLSTDDGPALDGGSTDTILRTP
jgi:hypothetical protein